MGACYSKNTTGTRPSAECRTQNQKNKISVRNRNWSTEGLSSEKVPLKDSENNFKQKIESPNTRTSESSTSDIVPDLLNLKHVDHSIAPSDSGIESIGTWHDDAQGSAQSKQERDEFLKQLEHQNQVVCHRCGNLKLNHFSPLMDSDFSCNRNQTAKSTVNTQCLAHGSQSKEGTIDTAKHDPNVSVLTDSNKHSTVSNSGMMKHCSHNDTDNSKLSSSLEGSNSVTRDRSLVVSLRSSKSSPSASLNQSKNKLSGIFDEERSETKAPLAYYESLDTKVNQSPSDKIDKQQNLFKDTQHITESVCKCDSQSDYCSTEDHGRNAAASEGTPYVLKPNPASKKLPAHHLESNISKSSSGVSAHKTAKSFLSNRQEEMRQCCISLDSDEAMISGSSSDSLVCGTVEDMASPDLDNTSRFTSQSNICIRQLMESAENATSPFNTTLPATVDGVECVIITKETYYQMQSDLSLVKQQLLCLSSLMQEDEGLEECGDCLADTSSIIH